MTYGLFKHDADPADVFAPPYDPVFSYLYSRVVIGAIPLYQANIPLALIRPFADDFRPDATPDGRKFIHLLGAKFETGNIYLPLWVYPAGDSFVLSDDHLPFCMLKERGIVSYWCEVMGDFAHAAVTQVRGPAPLDYVRKLMGGPDYVPDGA
jgi:hypothetical protein